MGRRLLKTWTIGLLGAFLLSVSPASSNAQGKPEVAQLRSQVRARVSALETAQRAEDSTRAEVDGLAHRIAALKRLKEQRPLASRTELDRLLKQSVNADRELGRRSSEVERQREALKRSVLEIVRSVDTEIRRLAPQMKTGSTESRKAAAARINKFLAFRRELASIRLSRQDTRPTEWTRYDVEIEALDGPSELNEKADFLEDHRDKIRAKKKALEKMLSRAIEEQRITKSNERFATDVGLFNESQRLERVPRGKASGSERAAADGAATAFTAGETGGSRSTSNEPSAPPPAQGGALPGSEFNANSGAGVSDDDQATRGTTPVQTPAFESLKPGIPKEVRAGQLLGLGVDQLAAGNLSPETLRRLLEEMSRLEGWLQDRSQHIRSRAQQLETDEAKVLGAP